MVQVTIPPNLSMYTDPNDPNPGELKIVSGGVLDVHHCDAIDDGVAVWSVQSGSGVTIALDTSNPAEGTGCIRVSVPTSTDAIIKCTKKSGSWDWSSYKYLKVWNEISSTFRYGTHKLWFGEAAYNEQSCVFPVPPNGVWGRVSWDISGIAAGSRNGVTVFAVELQNTGALDTFWIDYVDVDPGPAQAKGNDGDRVFIVYPKIYPSTYTGNNTDNTVITIPRKGTPAMIFVKKYNDGTYGALWWHKSMPSGYSEPFGASGINAITTGIKSVADGSFTIGTHALVNANGAQYNFFAIYED